MTSKFDRVFWLGDLNYRIIGKKTVIESLIYSNAHDVLIAHDQLNNEKKSGKIFEGFVEGSLSFRPTYKYDDGSTQYTTKERNPSWTDRILFKACEGITLTEYNCFNDITFSDHRPVFATFEVEYAQKMTLEPKEAPWRLCTIL